MGLSDFPQRHPMVLCGGTVIGFRVGALRGGFQRTETQDDARAGGCDVWPRTRGLPPARSPEPGPWAFPTDFLFWAPRRKKPGPGGAGGVGLPGLPAAWPGPPRPGFSCTTGLRLGSWNAWTVCFLCKVRGPYFPAFPSPPPARFLPSSPWHSNFLFSTTTPK